MNQRGGEIDRRFMPPENAPASFFPCPADPEFKRPGNPFFERRRLYRRAFRKLQVFGGRQPIINRDRLRA